MTRTEVSLLTRHLRGLRDTVYTHAGGQALDAFDAQLRLLARDVTRSSREVGVVGFLEACGVPFANAVQR